jgi:hypothetical protein
MSGDDRQKESGYSVPAFGPVRFYGGCVQADNLLMDVGVPVFLEDMLLGLSS